MVGDALGFVTGRPGRRGDEDGEAVLDAVGEGFGLPGVAAGLGGVCD